MAWRDRYKQASFRGVSFNFESSDDERSQRILTHEFPSRDKAFLEDLGKRPTKITIEAFVLGDDYLTLRDNLQAACAKSGAGKLVHPFYGEMTVKCDKITTRHDKGELGIARFSLSFIEVGDLTPIQSVVDTQTKTLLSARSVLDRQKTTFDKVFDYAGLPYSKAQSTLALVNTGIDAIAKARSLVAQVASYSAALKNIRGALSTLLLDAEQLASETIDLITFGFLKEDTAGTATPDSRQSFAGLSDLFTFAPFVSSETESSAAIKQLIQGASIAQGAHLLSIMTFDSINEASSLRDTLFMAIDSFLDVAGLDDDLYISVIELRSNVERDISERAVNLPRLVDLTLPEFTPAFVLSYRLYGDLDQEDSICRRNKVANPGLVPGGVPIKVVTDVG